VLKEYITDNKLDSRQEGFICERTWLYARKHSDLNYHILLLPIVRDFSSLVLKKEVVTSWVTQVEDSWSILDRTYKKASNHPIECLLFNREVFDQGWYVIDWASYFQKRELVWWSEVIVSCMTPAQKIRFRDIVLSDMALSPNRNNFKPIFEYINNNTNIG
jgi:hypothetical protein